MSDGGKTPPLLNASGALTMEEMRQDEIGEIAELAFFLIQSSQWVDFTPSCWVSSTRRKYYPQCDAPTDDSLGKHFRLNRFLI